MSLVDGLALAFAGRSVSEEERPSAALPALWHVSVPRDVIGPRKQVRAARISSGCDGIEAPIAAVDVSSLSLNCVGVLHYLRQWLS